MRSGERYINLYEFGKRMAKNLEIIYEDAPESDELEKTMRRFEYPYCKIM